MIAHGIVDVILGIDRIIRSVRAIFRPTYELQRDLEECQRLLGELSWVQADEREDVLEQQRIIEDELLGRGISPWRIEDEIDALEGDE